MTASALACAARASVLCALLTPCLLVACGGPVSAGDATSGENSTSSVGESTIAGPSGEGSAGSTTTGTSGFADASSTSGQPNTGDTSDTDSGTTGGESDCVSTGPIDAKGFSPATIAVDLPNANRVAPLGDVNGDGLDDFATNRAVVFGRDGVEPITEADLMAGDGGLWIGGSVTPQPQVASAGDFDGDGDQDLFFSRHGADFAGQNTGRLYVIPANPETAWDFEALNAGVGGLVIDGAGGMFGVAVAGVGDQDGDGFDDLVFAAPALGAGRVYGLRGSATEGLFGQAEIGNALEGWQLDGDPETAADLGRTVVPLGDISGDGTVDYALLARSSNRVFVVFGGPFAPDLDAIASGSGGYVVEFWGILSAGDINGDGLADLLLLSGRDTSSVVFGKSDTEPVFEADVISGDAGFRVFHNGTAVNAGRIDFAGDINGDGYGDFMAADSVYGDADNGRVWVVLGGCEGQDVQYGAIDDGVGGFVLDGAPSQRLGLVKREIGDFNGDGFDDAFIGTLGGGQIVLGAPLR